MDLHIHLTERFLHVQNVFGSRLKQALTMSPQGTDSAYFVGRAKAGVQKTN
jgi:hypothetical protein